jgi:hypothetical protein
MKDMWPLLCFASLGFLALISLVIYRVTMGNPKRAGRMQKVAIELGATYTFRDNGSLQQMLSQFPLIHYAKFRKITNVLQGMEECVHFMVFDYHYTKRVRGIYRRGSQDETVIVIYSPEFHFPEFAILPKNIMEPAIPNYHEIVLGKHSFFTEKYHVQGNDETAVKDLIIPHEKQLAAVLQSMNVQGNGQYLSFYRTRYLLSMAQIPKCLEAAIGVAEILY